MFEEKPPTPAKLKEVESQIQWFKELPIEEKDYLFNNWISREERSKRSAPR